MSYGFSRVLGTLLACTTATLAAPGARAQDAAATDERYAFDLPEQDLSDALRAIAERAEWELYAPAAALKDLRSRRLFGALSAREAILALLEGTGLEARFEGAAVVIRPRRPARDEPATEPAIIVTGSRIAGVVPAAPVAEITADDMRHGGQHDLGQAMRASPLNFAGGQNPGIGTGQGTANVNVNGSSSVNVLGLGPNATLTLLDGNRLSYTGVNAAVDISAIPIEAVDRVEIVADGSSALYGADAVAGVVNVKLKRDFDGFAAGARLGGATSGGRFEQQYDALAGMRWRGGGIMVAYDHQENTPILARDRSFTRQMAPDATLYPRLSRDGVLGRLDQDVANSVHLTFDALFNARRQRIVQGYLAGQSFRQSGGDAAARTQSLALAPTLSWELGRGWQVTFVGSIASDKTDIRSAVYAGGAVSSRSRGTYDNASLSADVSIQGALLELPAGQLRMVLGGGYRRTTLDYLAQRAGQPATQFDLARNNAFAYGEVNIPLIAPEQDFPAGRALTVSGAFRYEDNSGVGAVALPKLGLVYEPMRGVRIKASWGRSFRLPTLYEQYSGFSALLLPVGSYGSGYPPGASFIGLAGARRELSAERSESWTLTGELTPHLIEGLSLNLGYFHFDYRDRVASPVTSGIGVLDDPIYAELVTPYPTPGQQAEASAEAPLGLQNLTGAAYDPGQVVAILDIRTRNVARQLYRGVTGSARYRAELGDGQWLAADLSGAWLRSRQQLLPGLPETPLAGSVFNPPRLRGRAGLTLGLGGLTLSGYANLARGVTDRRQAEPEAISGFTTFDLAAQARVGQFELSVSVENLFDREPASIATASAYESPFDTTNASPVGRFLSVGLRSSW